MAQQQVLSAKAIGQSFPPGRRQTDDMLPVEPRRTILRPVATFHPATGHARLAMPSRVPPAGRKPGINTLSTRLAKLNGQTTHGWRDKADAGPAQAAMRALPDVLPCLSPASGKGFRHLLEPLSGAWKGAMPAGT